MLAPAESPEKERCCPAEGILLPKVFVATTAKLQESQGHLILEGFSAENRVEIAKERGEAPWSQSKAKPGGHWAHSSGQFG